MNTGMEPLLCGLATKLEAGRQNYGTVCKCGAGDTERIGEGRSQVGNAPHDGLGLVTQLFASVKTKRTLHLQSI